MLHPELNQRCHLQTDCQIVISEAEATQNRAGKLGQQNFVVINPDWVAEMAESADATTG